LSHQSFSWQFEDVTYSASFEYTREMLDDVRELSHERTSCSEYHRYIEDDPYLADVGQWLEEVGPESDEGTPGVPLKVATPV